jgi:hypothetical protein
MSKGWQNLGALLLAASFFICLMLSATSISLRGHMAFSYGGTVQGGLLTLLAVMVAWFSVRDGQRWGWWTLLFALLAIAISRLAVDRSCTVKIFWQHGCHQFMLGLVLGVIGLVLTRD